MPRPPHDGKAPQLLRGALPTPRVADWSRLGECVPLASASDLPSEELRPNNSSTPASTRELSTLRQMMEVPNEPGLSPNNGLENALLSDQSMASNPRKGQAKRSGAKTTSHDGKAGHHTTGIRINAGLSLPSPTARVASTLGVGKAPSY
ncbi:TPA: hypothetical protein ACH3X2_002958 [Trebouxia sp. C0005]